MVWDDGGSKVWCFVATTQMEGRESGIPRNWKLRVVAILGINQPPPTLPQTQI